MGLRGRRHAADQRSRELRCVYMLAGRVTLIAPGARSGHYPYSDCQPADDAITTLSSDEVKRHALNLGSISGWQSFWREIATSAEREQKMGYYAPAPFNASEDAQRAFGRKSPPTPEQCFGGMGDKCEGGIPGHPEVGPYPVATEVRRTGWYDDLRPVVSRESWMAPVSA